MGDCGKGERQWRFAGGHGSPPLRRKAEGVRGPRRNAGTRCPSPVRSIRRIMSPYFARSPRRVGVGTDPYRNEQNGDAVSRVGAVRERPDDGVPDAVDADNVGRVIAGWRADAGVRPLRRKAEGVRGPRRNAGTRCPSPVHRVRGIMSPYFVVVWPWARAAMGCGWNGRTRNAERRTQNSERLAQNAERVTQNSAAPAKGERAARTRGAGGG